MEPRVISLLDAVLFDLRQCDGIDGYSCHEPAVVHHLDSEQDFCLRCFAAFVRSGAQAHSEPYRFGSALEVPRNA